MSAYRTSESAWVPVLSGRSRWVQVLRITTTQVARIEFHSQARVTSPGLANVRRS